MSGLQPAKQTSRWGSLLSGAVAGLESRLDTILDAAPATEEARKTAGAGTATPQLAALRAEQTDSTSRASSRSRVNDKLNERLAKAVGKGVESERPSSELPSRTASPLPRTSTDSRTEDAREGASITGTATDSETRETQDDGNTTAPEADRKSSEAIFAIVTSASRPPMDFPSTRPSQDSNRPSLDSLPPTSESTIPSSQPALRRSSSFLESELSRVAEIHEERTRDYQEELHAHLERIDALQSKLSYLASQASTTARTAASAAPSGSAEKKVAEQEEKIVQLMEEGQRLSKTEMKHLGTIKKLRARTQEDDKSSLELKRKLEKTEQEREDMKERARAAENREKAAQERIQSFSKLSSELDSVRKESENSNLEVQDLKRQLAEAERRADNAERRAQTDKVEEQMRVVAELNDELSNSRIEKRLIEDRSKAEIAKIKEDAARTQEKTQLAELELRSEVQSLETKLELLRSRSEEVTSNTSTDAQAKLLRQVETLQTQYNLASENWQTLESTLNARLATVEKERDEIAKRETDIRKKAREMNSKARRFEEDFESERDKASTLEQDLAELKYALTKLQARLDNTEKSLQDSRAELEKERKNLPIRLEEEKTKWKLENHTPSNSVPPTPTLDSSQFLRAEFPTTYFTSKKPSTSDLRGFQIGSRRSNAGSRNITAEMPPLFTEHNRPPSRRTSTQPTHHSNFTGDRFTPPSRQDSTNSLHHVNGSLPMSASISVAPSLDAIDDQMDRDSTSSPHRTVNELLSTNTAAGPSVQLVERMSAAVRRLESEKAASKEEMTRLLGQRDEAREEVVSLMREMETLKTQEGRVEGLEKEVQDLKSRLDAALEMLGEKSEECEELKNDVLDLKKIYRELVESTLK